MSLGPYNNLYKLYILDILALQAQTRNPKP